MEDAQHCKIRVTPNNTGAKKNIHAAICMTYFLMSMRYSYLQDLVFDEHGLHSLMTLKATEYLCVYQINYDNLTIIM